MALITGAEIRAKRPLTASATTSGGVDSVELVQHVDDAQIKELLPRLGRQFYYAIVSTPADYSDLLTGGSYTYNSKTYVNPGLKAVLIDYAFARWRFFGGDKDTGFGFIEKQYQDGKQVGRERNKEAYTDLLQIAEQKWHEVALFLDRNYQDYPLWRPDRLSGNCTQPGPEYFSISKIST